MIIANTKDNPWSYTKHNLHNNKCDPGQEIRLRRAPGDSYQFKNHQPTDDLEGHGLGEVSWEMTVWLKKRRGSRQSQTQSYI